MAISPSSSHSQDRRSARVFNRFWIANLSSNLGDGMMITALPMVAAMLTNDPLLVAGLTVMRFLPRLIFSLFVGVLVDRASPIRLMLVSNVLRASSLALLALFVLTGHANLTLLYFIMFAVMTCEVIYDTAADTVVPRLVSTSRLDRANSRIEGGRVVTESFAGAPVAGFLFIIAAALPLAANAGAYLLGGIILLSIPLVHRRAESTDQGHTDQAHEPTESMLSAMKEGIKYLLQERSLLGFTIFNVIMNMAFTMQSAILVLLVQDHFGVPDQLYGIFLSVSAVGALIGAWLVQRSILGIGRFKTEMFAFTMMGICCIGFVLSPNIYIGAVFWAVLCAMTTLSNTVIVGVLQLAIPRKLLGRILSTTRMLAMGLSPIGAIIGGFLARAHLTLPSLVAGGTMLVATLFVVSALREITKRADQEERERKTWEDTESSISDKDS